MFMNEKTLYQKVISSSMKINLSNNSIVLSDIIQIQSIKTTSSSNAAITYKPYSPKIFCIILSTPGSYKSNKAFTILNTWAWKCDDYRFISKLPTNLVVKSTSDCLNTSLFLFANGTIYANGQQVGQPVNIIHP